MRRLLVAVSVAGLLLVNSLAVGAAAPTNFAGTWALDKAKSKDLPPQMESIKTYTLTVTQDAQQLTTDTKIERTFNFQGNDVTSTSTEIWELSGDGKTLTIQRTSESPRGTQKSTLIFNKQ